MIVRNNINLECGGVLMNIISCFQQFKCPFSDRCEVTVVTRRFCQKCRLKKCVDIGKRGRVFSRLRLKHIFLLNIPQDFTRKDLFKILYPS